MCIVVDIQNILWRKINSTLISFSSKAWTIPTNVCFNKRKFSAHILTVLLADPILKQVPLIKNPSYQPPKAISLRTNYSKLLPTLSHTVVPPNLNITKEDIDKWLNEIDEYKTMIANEQKTDSSVANYEKWIKSKAPKLHLDLITTFLRQKVKMYFV